MKSTFTMNLVFVLSLLSTIIAVCSGLTNLDDGTLQSLDVEVRREIVPMIGAKIKSTLEHKKALSAQCESKINAAVSSCNACKKDICKPTIVDEIKHVASNVGHSISSGIKHIFGRKKRCSSSCPICDTLDISKHTHEQTLISVCGSSLVSKEKSDTEAALRLKKTYDTILANQLVTKVEYDTASIRTDGGVSFTTNYITYNISGHSQRFQSSSELKISDVKVTAKSVASKHG